METDYLKTLVTVIESGSFSKAADLLRITQPAVSQRIKLLEDRYNVELLTRTNNALMPTAAGELVMQRARAIMAHEMTLRKELEKYPIKKRLSLCFSPCFSACYLPDILNGFMRKHTEAVDFQVMLDVPTRALKGLSNAEFDLTVIEHYEQLALSDYQNISLPLDEMVFISSPRLLLSAPVLTIEELLQQTLVIRKEECSSRKQLTMNLAILGRELADFRRVMIIDDLNLILNTVISGDAIAFVSKNLVRKQIEEGKLDCHTVSGFDHKRFRTIVTNKALHHDKTVNNFIEQIIAVLNKQNQSPELPAYSRKSIHNIPPMRRAPGIIQ